MTIQNFIYHNLGEYKEPSLDLIHLLDSCPPVIGVDTETVSLKDKLPLGVSIAISPSEAFYFPLYPERSPIFPWHILRDPSIKKVYHNALWDLDVLEPFDLDNTNVADTTVLAHLLNLPGELSELQYHIDRSDIVSAREMLGAGKTMLDLPIEEVASKCCRDAEATLQAYIELLPAVREYAEEEFELIPILFSISKRGIAVDQEWRKMLDDKLSKEVEYYRTLCEAEGFNPASTQQVGYILAKRGNFLPFTRSRRQLATDEKTLKKVKDPMAAIVLQFRHTSYLLNHYIKPLAGQDRGYTRYHLDARTGRPSSTDRNMQNIPPGEVRGMFIPDGRMFCEFDLSQIELRVLAWLSQDKEMLAIFEAGEDIHQYTAEFLNIERKLAKNVNFCMVYGGTDETIMETAGIDNIGRARDLKRMWFRKYKGAGDWIEGVQKDTLDTMECLTLGGRVIRIDPAYEKSEGAIRRKAVNYPIQASASEIMKNAMRKCGHLEAVLQVHDSELFEGDVKEELLALDLENSIAPFRTPFSIKLLERWE